MLTNAHKQTTREKNLKQLGKNLLQHLAALIATSKRLEAIPFLRAVLVTHTFAI